MKQRFHHLPSTINQQRGQVALIVLLMMMAILIVGLSLAVRTAEDLLLTTSQAESARVFSAAEAGIEEALSQGFDFIGNEQFVSLGEGYYDLADVSYSVTKQNIVEVQTLEGASLKIDLSTAASMLNPLLDINWSETSNCLDNPASLIISVYYDDAGTIAVRHYGLAGCDRGDGFILAGASGQSGFSFYYQLPLTPTDLVARIRPVYNDTKLMVSSANFTLPTQSYLIRAEAKNTVGNESRAVMVERSLPTQASVFDFALVSGINITK